MNADEREEWRAGYGWLVERAQELRGDLRGIVELELPADRSDPELWSYGFYAARMDLIDLLLPDDASIEEHLASHEPDEADAQAVEAFVEACERPPGERSTISTIRRGLFGGGAT